MDKRDYGFIFFFILIIILPSMLFYSSHEKSMQACETLAPQNYETVKYYATSSTALHCLYETLPQYDHNTCEKVFEATKNHGYHVIENTCMEAKQ